jgi:gamma-glutamyl-gamma-aminobutyrate hydrolase PuuD
MKPVIAITPEAITLQSRIDGRGAFCGASYSQAIELAGGVPFILPLTRERGVLNHFLKTCDGLLLTGGGDVAAKWYAPRMPRKLLAKLSGVDVVRDEMEIHLLRRAAKADMPVLAICRGIQVMNVAFGGTLVPDIPSCQPKALAHRNPKPDALAHEVEWARTAKLARIWGCNCAAVNTSHHQAVDRVAPSFDVVARSADGIVEAMEMRGKQFFCAVQFHPERLVNKAPEFLGLFEALVAAARRR